MSVSVCLCVCLFVCPPPRACLPNYMYAIFANFRTLPIAVARSSSGGVAIRCVLPVLWMTPYLHVLDETGACRSIPLRRVTSLRRRVQARRRCCFVLVPACPKRDGDSDFFHFHFPTHFYFIARTCMRLLSVQVRTVCIRCVRKKTKPPYTIYNIVFSV